MRMLLHYIDGSLSTTKLSFHILITQFNDGIANASTVVELERVKTLIQLFFSLKYEGRF